MKSQSGRTLPLIPLLFLLIIGAGIVFYYASRSLLSKNGSDYLSAVNPVVPSEVPALETRAIAFDMHPEKDVKAGGRAMFVGKTDGATEVTFAVEGDGDALLRPASLYRGTCKERGTRLFDLESAAWLEQFQIRGSTTTVETSLKDLLSQLPLALTVRQSAEQIDTVISCGEILDAQVGVNVELLIQDIEEGEGAQAAAGDVLEVHYEGRLENGEKFDSSYDRGEPFTFQLGAGRVIRGWELGIAGMREGGKRKLIIPSELGYGPAGYGEVIPPNAKLIFEVELIDVEGKE